jgi:Holliday junction resolvase RusA-like endonuclease
VGKSSKPDSGKVFPTGDHFRTWGFTLEAPLIGYVRTTQRQKWVDPRYKRYAMWKKMIRLIGNTKGIPDKLTPADSVSVQVEVYWKKKATHDIDNVLKGVLDSLWSNDRRVVNVHAFCWENTGKEHANIKIERW